VGKEKFDNNIQGYLNDHGLVIDQKNLGDDPWTFENPVMLKIKNKVEAQGTQIKSWEIKISRGLITGFNEAFVIENDIKQSLIAS
jgi:adenine-specific DNA-methyltransferase